MKKQFYHETSIDHTQLFYLTEDEEQDFQTYHGNLYGPFKTLRECKKDAVNYHLATIYHARNALSEVRKTSKKDIE